MDGRRKRRHSPLSGRARSFTHFSAAEDLKFARQRRTETAGPRRL
jgi:hypothetical protein